VSTSSPKFRHSSCQDFFTHFSRVKKKKLKAGREGKDKPAVKFETSIEGVVPTTYRFGSLCDFQYLCMERKDDEFKSLYPQVHFSCDLVGFDEIKKYI